MAYSGSFPATAQLGHSSQRPAIPSSRPIVALSNLLQTLLASGCGTTVQNVLQSVSLTFASLAVEKLTHCEHHSRFLSEIGLPSVPKPQIADDDAAFVDDWLGGGSDFSASVEQVLLDPATGAVTVFALLVSKSGTVVSTKPDLC